MRLLVGALVCMIATGACAQSIRKIDLSQVEGTIGSLADGVVQITTEDATSEVPVAEVAEIRLTSTAATDLWRRRGGKMLMTTRGDLLDLTFLAFDGEQVTVTSDLLGTRTIGLSDLHAAYLPNLEQTASGLAGQAEQSGIATGTKDRLLVREGDRWLSVEGILEAINFVEGETEPKLTFHWRDESRELEMDRVGAILLADAPEGDSEDSQLAGWVLAADGSRLGFTDIAMDETTVTFDAVTFGDAIELPREKVVAIEFVSDRVAVLSELTPDAQSTEGMILDAIEYRVDEAIDGGAITLDGVSYETGVAIHSRTELTWDIAGEYASFVAVVGIDDAVRPGGDATLELVADGNVIETLRLTGKDDATVLRCDLTDVMKFTIRVDFGEDGLESGDHVDLAMARLIKSE